MASFVRNSVRLWRITHTNATAFVQQSRTYKAKWVAPTLREFKRRKIAEIEKNGGFTQTHRSTYLEWNYDAEVYAFANRLGETFDDKLLRQAFTHKSYVTRETERLKALGVETGLDNLTVNDELAEEGKQLLRKNVLGYLRVVFPRAPEECIEAVLNYLVSEEILADVAKHLGITDLMLCADFPPANSTLVKSLEAVIAALERSSGSERTKSFVDDFIVTQLYGKDVAEIWNPTNPMGIVVDILKREGRGEPEPRLLRKTGANTIMSAYHVGIYSDRQLVGAGFGESVEIAQEMAARDALRRLFHLEDNAAALPFGRQLQSLKPHMENAATTPNLSVDRWTSDQVKNLITC